MASGYPELRSFTPSPPCGQFHPPDAGPFAGKGLQKPPCSAPSRFNTCAWDSVGCQPRASALPNAGLCLASASTRDERPRRNAARGRAARRGSPPANRADPGTAGGLRSPCTTRSCGRCWSCSEDARALQLKAASTPLPSSRNGAPSAWFNSPFRSREPLTQALPAQVPRDRLDTAPLGREPVPHRITLFIPFLPSSTSNGQEKWALNTRLAIAGSAVASKSSKSSARGCPDWGEPRAFPFPTCPDKAARFRVFPQVQLGCTQPPSAGGDVWASCTLLPQDAPAHTGGEASSPGAMHGRGVGVGGVSCFIFCIKPQESLSQLKAQGL